MRIETVINVPCTLAGLAAGLVVLAGFIGWELRRRAPMIDPRVFARPALAAGSLSIFVQFFALAFTMLSALTLPYSAERPVYCLHGGTRAVSLRHQGSW